LVIDGLMSPDGKVPRQHPKWMLDKATCEKFDELGWHYVSAKINMKGEEGEDLPKNQKILKEDGSKTLHHFPNPHLSYKIEDGNVAYDRHFFHRQVSLTDYLQAIDYYDRAHNLRVR
jgi:hypothetical protein